MAYQPNLESIRTHTVPDWFHDAKFGIFIHWGLYSVPSWAPVSGDIQEIIKRDGFGGLMRQNPYAEWYLNSLRIPGTPTEAHHAVTYGEDFPYERFQIEFERTSERMDPDDWATLFAESGARYVVLVTKHHDGYTLWPTDVQNPRTDGFSARRDLVGELSQAVRRREMRMGLYYSGVLDWTFRQEPILDLFTFLENQRQSEEYVDYATAQFKELIDRYAPSILWNDIGYPALGDVPELVSYYYNRVPDGVVNDRFRQTNIPGSRVGRAVMKALISVRLALARGGLPDLASPHYDFRTPEYATYDEIKAEKWESTRGIGHSFGYNQLETDAQMLGGVELIRMLTDIVSKNGNLLLNVGPKADGTIPDMQRKPLAALGKWLSRYGDAIYGTRPYRRAASTTSSELEVRFTRRGDTVFAIVHGSLESAVSMGELSISGVAELEGKQARLVGRDEVALKTAASGTSLSVRFPDDVLQSAAGDGRSGAAGSSPADGAAFVLRFG